RRAAVVAAAAAAAGSAPRQRIREHPSQLRAELGITDGNLDAHLRKFATAGYLHSEMITEGRPHTIYRLSPSVRSRSRATSRTSSV
ncbi:MAG: transcriptional regulator, partial [Alphaproteobacteria bacterium]|nr:transcriptional regulator [Alphaproteobacteria bacterium]